MTIDPQGDGKVLGIAHRCSGDKIGEGTGGVEGFGDFPGETFVLQFALDITQGQIDGDTVTGHRIQGVSGGNPLDGTTDEERQLDFMLTVLRKSRDDDPLPFADDAARRFHEEDRTIGNFIPQFANMFGVISRDTDNFSQGKRLFFADNPYLPHLFSPL